MKKDIRQSVLILVICSLLFIEIGAMFYNSAIVPGVSVRADKMKLYAQASREDKSIQAGSIYDRNEIPLFTTTKKSVRINVETKGENDETIVTTKDVTETNRVYTHGLAYSQLIGYTGNRHLNYNAVSLDKVVGGRNDYRLLAFLDEDYWKEKGLGLYETVDPEGREGMSAVLTLDHGLQVKVFDILAEEMEPESSMGSAVVMDVKTGEILSMVSFPAYDFNSLDDALKQMKKDEAETNLEPSFPVSYKKSVAPGSIFKILVAVCLLEHDMEDFTVNDTTYTLDGWTCHNAYSKGSGEVIDYKTAIVRSSNVFFSKAALALGEERLSETMKLFGLNEKEDYLELDMGNVPYNLDIKGASDVLLAQSGFGQGKVELTTLGAASITQAIANGGQLCKPYLIKEIQDSDGNVLYEGKSEKYKVCKKSSADMVSEAMFECALYNSNAYASLKDTAVIFDKYKVAGKTGTAQNGDAQNTTNSWFVSFAPLDNPQYVVVVNQCKDHKGGYQMMRSVGAIYEYLFEEYKY